MDYSLQKTDEDPAHRDPQKTPGSIFPLPVISTSKCYPELYVKKDYYHTNHYCHYAHSELLEKQGRSMSSSTTSHARLLRVVKKPAGSTGYMTEVEQIIDSGWVPWNFRTGI
jgi:hypothetical protein